MESLQERKRKISGCAADKENQLNEKSTGERAFKLSKMEFFSRDKPWPRCIKLNKLSAMKTSINTEKTILNSDEENSASFSGISSIDMEEYDEEFFNNLQLLEQSYVGTVIHEDGEKSSDQVPINNVSWSNTETMTLNSGEKCSVLTTSGLNSSGIIFMESDKHIEESTKSLKLNRVNTTPNKNGDRSSVEVSTKTTKIVLNSPEKCFASSSVINSVESEKHNKESKKLLESNHKHDKKSLDKEFSADSSVNTSIENDPHEDSSQELDLACFAAIASKRRSNMSNKQKRGWDNAIPIREGIGFFLTNGYFEESFINENNHVYEMFVKFFNTNLKHLTPIDHGMKIFDGDERKELITDSLFKDDDGQIFMYFWTTTRLDITKGCINDIRKYYVGKLNIHRHILEKPQNCYDMKISDTFLIRLNSFTSEAQIGKIDRIVDKAILQKMVRYC